jgi:DNA repair protein RecO (recombination protein O)
MRRSEPAICLKARDYSETSQILVFLTRDSGVVSLIAKGTKRKKSKSGGAVDMFSEGELLYTRKNPNVLGTLMEFSETVSHTSLRKDSDRLNVALYAIELAVEMIQEYDPHPEIFDLLSRTLRRLGEDDAPLMPVLAYYLKRFLSHAGVLGDLDRCVACGEQVGDDTCFAGRLGGLVCRECGRAEREKTAVDSVVFEGLSILREAESGRRVDMTEAQARAVVGLLDYHVTCQLSRPLKMSAHLTGA